VSDPTSSIFADPKGIRRRILQVVTVVGILSLLAATAYFFAGLLILPQLNLPSVVRDFHARFKALPSAKAPARDAKDDWRRIHATANAEKTGALQAGKVVLGFVSESGSGLDAVAGTTFRRADPCGDRVVHPHRR